MFSVIVVIYEWVLVSASSDDMVQLCCFVNFDRYGVSPVIMQRASFDTLRYALAMYVCMYVCVCVYMYYLCMYKCMCATYVLLRVFLCEVFTTFASYYIEATHTGTRLVTLTFQRILRP